MNPLDPLALFAVGLLLGWGLGLSSAYRSRRVRRMEAALRDRLLREEQVFAALRSLQR